MLLYHTLTKVQFSKLILNVCPCLLVCDCTHMCVRVRAHVCVNTHMCLNVHTFVCAHAHTRVGADGWTGAAALCPALRARGCICTHHIRMRVCVCVCIWGVGTQYRASVPNCARAQQSSRGQHDARAQPLVMAPKCCWEGTRQY